MVKKYIIFFLSVNILLAYWWADPKNLGIQDTDDRNPQACREQVNGHTCMVWQTMLNGNWDIFSRFGSGNNWLGDTTWTDTFRITVDTFFDVYPSVAYDSSRDYHWCVWQSNRSGNSDIYVSYGDTINGWSSPHQLTTAAYADERPSICLISDTLWVVWQIPAGINFSFYDGANWSTPAELAPIGFNPRINRRHGHPFVVWDNLEFIFYSEYIDSTWQGPQQITFDYWHEKPEIVIDPSGFESVWIIWQSYRDGNYEVYATFCDSFHIHQRITNNDSVDFETSGLGYMAIDKNRQYYEVPSLAFSTDRNGNFDIYNYWSWGGGYDTIVPVDTVLSEDRNPVMTGGGFSLWILWQTDRNGDWDIYGSTVCVNQIEESNEFLSESDNILTIQPNPFTKNTRITLSMMQKVKSTKLKIYDATGSEVKNFPLPTSLSTLPAAFFWDGSDNDGIKLSAGVYFIRLQSDTQKIAKKVIFIE